jgi:Nif-specific regulatory protein
VTALTETDRLRLERDLFLRLLELGAREDLRPLLADALALVADAAGARRGYLELARAGAGGAPGFWIARGFSDAELPEVRRAISTGIVQQALATGRTVSTASALDDPRFQAHASVQAQRIRAVLCAPIGAEAPLGVIYLQDRAGPGPFPEDARVRVEVMARHLAPFVDRLLAREEAETEIDATADLRRRLAAGGIAGHSPALAEVLRQVLVAAPVPVAVLITGESGTGKTAIARVLHDSSPRAAGPFVEVNCAAIPETLFESELFGAEKGAHSTATRRIEGKVDAARGGTLLLDEVGEIPLSLQSKLLQFLQSRRYYRLGSQEPIVADVRVVAATNQDLEERVREKRFREDLYYRLAVLEVRVPPLRERREDVVAIAVRAVAALAAMPPEGGAGDARGASDAPVLSRAARVALAEAEWPGNVWQLENVIARGWATALSEGATSIEPRHLFGQRAGAGPAVVEPAGELPYQEATRRFQARLLVETLEATQWNVSEAARRLELSRSHLNDLLRAHGISRGRATAR